MEVSAEGTAAAEGTEAEAEAAATGVAGLAVADADAEFEGTMFHKNINRSNDASVSSSSSSSSCTNGSMDAAEQAEVQGGDILPACVSPADLNLPPGRMHATSGRGILLSSPAATRTTTAAAAAAASAAAAAVIAAPNQHLPAVPAQGDLMEIPPHLQSMLRLRNHQISNTNSNTSSNASSKNNPSAIVGRSRGTGSGRTPRSRSRSPLPLPVNNSSKATAPATTRGAGDGSNSCSNLGGSFSQSNSSNNNNNNNCISGSNSSISSLDDLLVCADFDQDILTDRAGLQELDPLETSSSKLDTTVHRTLTSVNERLSEDTLEDVHAFSDATCLRQQRSGTAGAPSSTATNSAASVGGGYASSNASRATSTQGYGEDLLEPLCEEEEEDLSSEDDDDKKSNESAQHYNTSCHDLHNEFPPPLQHETTHRQIILTNMENLRLSSREQQQHHQQQQLQLPPAPYAGGATGHSHAAGIASGTTSSTSSDAAERAEAKGGDVLPAFVPPTDLNLPPGRMHATSGRCILPPATGSLKGAKNSRLNAMTNKTKSNKAAGNNATSTHPNPHVVPKGDLMEIPPHLQSMLRLRNHQSNANNSSSHSCGNRSIGGRSRGTNSGNTPRSRSRSPLPHNSSSKAATATATTTTRGLVDGSNSCSNLSGNNYCISGSNSSISSIEDLLECADFDEDILTDRAGLQELDPLENSSSKVDAAVTCTLTSVNERLSEDTLEDVHAFSDAVVQRQRISGVSGSIASTSAGGGGGYASSNASRATSTQGYGEELLEPLCEEEEEDLLDDDDPPPEGNHKNSSNDNSNNPTNHDSAQQQGNITNQQLHQVILTNMENLRLSKGDP